MTPWRRSIVASSLFIHKLPVKQDRLYTRHLAHRLRDAHLQQSWGRQAHTQTTHTPPASPPALSDQPSSVSSTSNNTAPSSASPVAPIVSHHARGRWYNPFATWQDRGVLDLLRWQLFSRRPNPHRPSDYAEYNGSRDNDRPYQTRPQFVLNRDGTIALDEALPVMTPSFYLHAGPDVPYGFATSMLDMTAPSSGLSYTWLGHAAALVTIDGYTLLIDPWMTERPFPLQYVGPKRFRRVPTTVEELPSIDGVFISHNHYDHLCHITVNKLRVKLQQQQLKNKRPARWHVPKGVKSWLIRWAQVDSADIDEYEWWESRTQQHTVVGGDVTVHCVPSQHWSGRYAIDMHRSLWCGFVVQRNGRSLYYSGDTGHCTAFAAIRQRLGAITAAVLPIGAYNPEWFLQPMHMTPEQALDAHLTLQSRRSFAVHWGTVVLSDEFIMDPQCRLQQAVATTQMNDTTFTTTNIGQTLHYDWDKL